jgi:hypothetical protein
MTGNKDDYHGARDIISPEAWGPKVIREIRKEHPIKSRWWDFEFWCGCAWYKITSWIFDKPMWVTLDPPVMETARTKRKLTQEEYEAYWDEA